jgi:hypothetical protein
MLLASLKFNNINTPQFDTSITIQSNNVNRSHMLTVGESQNQSSKPLAI